jgi:hypothetical protein
MTLHSEAIRPPSRRLLLGERRAVYEFGALLGAYPLLRRLPSGDGHPVLILPGFVASDVSTVPLRTFLRGRGYQAHGWNLGRNLGLRPGLKEGLLARLRELRGQHGRKVSLIGWSLGGVYARELAKLAVDDVRLVITLGSPFKGNTKATHATNLYDTLSDRTVEDAQVTANLHHPPPVPTTAIFSRTDGVVAWQCCVEDAGPHTESIEVRSSHCGMGHHPAALYAIADRLAQPEHSWKPFDRGGMRALFYPRPHQSNSDGSWRSGLR